MIGLALRLLCRIQGHAWFAYDNVTCCWRCGAEYRPRRGT